MKRTIGTLLAALLATSFFASLALAEDAPLALTLKESIRRGVENNLEVRTELYNPAGYEAEINRNRGIYDLLFSAATNYNDNETLSAAVLPGSDSELQTFHLDSSLSQLFSSGATAAIGFDNVYTRNVTGAPTLLPDYWQSQLSLRVRQPLLKDFGRENTEVNINVSRLGKAAALDHFDLRLESVVAQVRNEYFRLFSLREEREVQKVSLELARKILAETKARVEAGVLPAMEILNAEFAATTREKELIDAERAVSDQMDVLRLLLQITAVGEIETIDLPERDPISVDEEQALQRSLSRPEIREQLRNLEIAELQNRVFANRTRPDLALTGSASFSGLDRSYPDNLAEAGSFATPSWGIGLIFSYPLGNNVADNDYRKSRLKSEQLMLQIRQLEEVTAKEVKAAIRSISSGYKQLDVADRGRAYAEERLKAFIRKNEVGLATGKDVMDVENDLVAAKKNQILAAVNYTNAITGFWLVTGELLEREGITVNDAAADADALYKGTAR